MANIGVNTNHRSGTGRSYNTPEKQFGKEIGQAKYLSKPEYAFDLGFSQDAEGMSQASIRGSIAKSFTSWVKHGKKMSRSMGASLKRNRGKIFGTVVVLGALTAGMHFLRQRSEE